MTTQSIPPSVFTLPQTAQLEALYTIIRDKNTSRGDFLFYSDRIIRLLVEEGLNHLPVIPKTVETPTVRSQHQPPQCPLWLSMLFNMSDRVCMDIGCNVSGRRLRGQDMWRLHPPCRRSKPFASHVLATNQSINLNRSRLWKPVCVRCAGVSE